MTSQTEKKPAPKVGANGKNTEKKQTTRRKTSIATASKPKQRTNATKVKVLFDKGLASENRKLRRSKKYKEIRNDLSNQIERNGTIGKYYSDLVDDYMDLWLVKCALLRDIEETGLTVTTFNARGQEVQKKNDSVELSIKVNAQMLKLLSEIGIKPSQAGGDDDEL